MAGGQHLASQDRPTHGALFSQNAVEREDADIFFSAKAICNKINKNKPTQLGNKIMVKRNLHTSGARTRWLPGSISIFLVSNGWHGVLHKAHRSLLH